MCPLAHFGGTFARMFKENAHSFGQLKDNKATNSIRRASVPSNRGDSPARLTHKVKKYSKKKP